MSLVDTYLAGLRKALPAERLNELKHAHGASTADVQRLNDRYPLCPASLLELLGQIDGTHYRDYPDGRVMVLVLGSDVFEYPYYLSSIAQILEESDTYTRSIAQIYAGYLDEEPDLVGPGIDISLGMHERLCFSHCMNNGGSSKLYIDFNPVAGGNVGQVVRYLHDPDSYKVIAPSFDHYLQQLIDENYAFVFEDEDY
ncbi:MULTISPECIES: SMI1/KNR4 family protein [Pseudomonas syringae group]|uniref:KNR4-like cell wall assembly/cell proliferation coordinating protein n=1 Tax=Pseudomonas syringae pv. ribicola TaxID=55398 RepID=A0A0P9ZHM8_PSESI|nr:MULTISPECIES: SMI1/KNR4 family protein [Pseudomonas syringae group]EKN48260.1 KNR4-like cell wall assembly/cell proliferation coordinating protein [Pseudomonas viridiflava UASWS0038]KPL65162.1 cell wall assembly protein [Pseudomonas viridiflava]KPY49941.1 KNR4-like cell wall assembly/cell proliferation coordinating protein [Pseudomonas syringae pv. ribicola]KPZ16037.1 KNR4-like cell wall assembly/cell proliferation coordinating protein [Pseudomonas viridiflava]OAG88114.1 cell wall assembly 